MKFANIASSTGVNAKERPLRGFGGVGTIPYLLIRGNRPATKRLVEQDGDKAGLRRMILRRQLTGRGYIGIRLRRVHHQPCLIGGIWKAISPIGRKIPVKWWNGFPYKFHSSKQIILLVCYVLIFPVTMLYTGPNTSYSDTRILDTG